MDRRLEQQTPRSGTAPAPAPRHFEPVAEERDRTYPMFAPAAAVAATSEEDLEDVQPNAGLVNV